MAQRRGSAKALLAMGVGILCLMALARPALAASTYTVGGARGWTFNVNTWPRGKPFKAGDVLVFNYASSANNVVPVGKRGYDTCSPGGAKVFRTGRDKMKLRKGHNYFICSVANHCQSRGMKIDVLAS